MSLQPPTAADSGAGAQPQASAEHADVERHPVAGIVTMVASSVSNQAGAAVGALAFPVIGSTGVVAVRQLVTALVLGLAVRPDLRSMSAHQLRPVVALAFVFGLMNVSLYFAVERIGLGLAVTLEFLGPLAVAICASRRAVDLACAVVAGVAVVILVSPGPSTDYIGIGSAVVAALCWASYILLNRTLGQRVTGLRGTSAAAVVSAIVWVPIAAGWFIHHPPTFSAVMLAVACGLLASVVPLAADMIALRHVPPGIFGTFTSLNPVWAALCGAMVLDELLTPWQWSAVGLIVTGNIVVAVSTISRRRRSSLSQGQSQQATGSH